MKKMRKRAEIFGRYEKNAYLCNVKRSLLAIRAESREGKTKSTLPILKESPRCGSFLFQVSLHEHLDVVATFYELSGNGQELIALQNQHFTGGFVALKIVLNVFC